MTTVTLVGIQKWGHTVVRILLGLVFVYAGVAKALSNEDFAAKISAFRIVPAHWSFYVAQGLPFFEAIAGFWLLLGWRRRVPALAVLLMTGVLTAVVVLSMARGLNISCGCFGAKGPADEGLAVTLITDFLLLGGAWIVYRNALLSTGG